VLVRLYEWVLRGNEVIRCTCVCDGVLHMLYALGGLQTLITITVGFQIREASIISYPSSVSICSRY